MLQTFNPKNEDLQVYVGDQLYHRSKAKVSVFDSVVQGGDGVWEGLRLYNGGIFLLERHLQRLQDSARAMAYVDIPTNDEIIVKISETLKANSMHDGVHIRLTLTRGEKITSGMDPRLNQSGSVLIILPEYKVPVYDNASGISVITSSIRRNSPNNLDSKIHHNNLINNILAKIQSNVAGVDAALMLDNYGFAAELNGTNIFTVKQGKIYTPHADACLHGVTRGFVIELARKAGYHMEEKNLSPTELYAADEVFCTGTMGELTPITMIDGRKIGTDQRPILAKLNAQFHSVVAEHCTKVI